MVNQNVANQCQYKLKSFVGSGLRWPKAWPGQKVKQHSYAQFRVFISWRKLARGKHRNQNIHIERAHRSTITEQCIIDTNAGKQQS